MGNGQARAQEIHCQLQGRNPKYLLHEKVEAGAFTITIPKSSIVISVSCQNPDFDIITIHNDKDNICGYANDVKRFTSYYEVAEEIDRIVALVM